MSIVSLRFIILPRVLISAKKYLINDPVERAFEIYGFDDSVLLDR
jgi:hypothetical protein